MASLRTATLPSLRRQHLMSEFAGLRQACPEGVFVSLTPGDAALWSAVLFVREGPYSPAVLRFQISFPDSYPRFPPLVTFSSDMFHPLITPLTTYMYTTDIQDNGTVSATDDERLPPGGFSLRHGFPEWFGRGRRSAQGSRQASGQHAATENPATPVSPETPRELPNYMQTTKKTILIYEVLKYIRSSFDDEAVLDSVPLDAAGNPGAWHAWRTHRRKLGKLAEDRPVASEGEAEDAKKEAQEAPLAPAVSTPSHPSARTPAEWNWDGVWEDRVKKGIASSLSEPALYGGSGLPDDLINFLAMEETEIDSIKENLRRTLGSPV